MFGALGRIRTSDRSVRSRVLYPAELRVRFGEFNQNTAGTAKARGFVDLAHSGGFEPPTARFVAEYSIQLSYECVEAAYSSFRF